MPKAEKKPDDFIKLLRKTKTLFFTKVVSDNFVESPLKPKKL